MDSEDQNSLVYISRKANITQAAISSRKNLTTKRPMTTMTRENITSQLKSLLLYSLMKRARDLASIWKRA